MKRLFTALLALALLTGHITVPVSAEKRDISLENIFENELSSAIISGSGIEDDPYIIDPALAPLFSVYLKQCGKTALSGNTLAGTSEYSVNGFGTSLQGTSYNAPKGFVWIYKSGGLPVSGNGNVRFRHIEYINYQTVKESYDNRDLAKGVIDDWGSTIASFTFNGAIDFLKKKGIKSDFANKIVNLMGKSSISNGFAFAMFLIEFSNWYTNSYLWRQAISHKNGFIVVDYLSAYNGSWYAYMSTEEWTTQPYAYSPKSSFGTGTYKIRN